MTHGRRLRRTFPRQPSTARTFLCLALQLRRVEPCGVQVQVERHTPLPMQSRSARGAHFRVRLQPRSRAGHRQIPTDVCRIGTPARQRVPCCCRLRAGAASARHTSARARAQRATHVDALLKLGWLGARPRAGLPLELFFLPLLRCSKVRLDAARQAGGRRGASEREREY